MAEAGLPTPIARVSLCQALTASAPVSGFTCTNTLTTPNAMDPWHNPEQPEVPRLISLKDHSERETVATSQQDRVESERRHEAQGQRSTPTSLSSVIRCATMGTRSPCENTAPGELRLLTGAEKRQQQE